MVKMHNPMVVCFDSLPACDLNGTKQPCADVPLRNYSLTHQHVADRRTDRQTERHGTHS